MGRDEMYANAGFVCQKHLEVARWVCHMPWLQPVKPHFTSNGAVYTFAGMMLPAHVSPFPPRSQISLAASASASMKSKHLDEK